LFENLFIVSYQNLVRNIIVSLMLKVRRLQNTATK